MQTFLRCDRCCSRIESAKCSIYYKPAKKNVLKPICVRKTGETLLMLFLMLAERCNLTYPNIKFLINCCRSKVEVLITVCDMHHQDCLKSVKQQHVCSQNYVIVN